jgi:hypothetical protein
MPTSDRRVGALTLALLLLLVSGANAQPVLISPTCDVSWTEAWIRTETDMHPPKLSYYEVEFAPASKGPYSLVTFAIVAVPTGGAFTAQCPGYIPSGTYCIRITPYSRGGWQRGKHTRPVCGVLDRGENP